MTFICSLYFKPAAEAYKANYTHSHTHTVKTERVELLETQQITTLEEVQTDVQRSF